jgi:hypothetical protein
MELLVLLFALALFAGVAETFGVDSRDGFIDRH